MIFKTAKTIINLLITAFLLTSCYHNHEINCGQNTHVKVNDINKCAVAEVTGYVFREEIPEELISIGFNFGEDSFYIGIKATEIQAGKQYNYPGDIIFTFPEFKKSGSGTLTIDAFDREKRIISGHFDISAEGVDHSLFEFSVKGAFTKLDF